MIFQCYKEYKVDGRDGKAQQDRELCSAPQDCRASTLQLQLGSAPRLCHPSASPHSSVRSQGLFGKTEALQAAELEAQWQFPRLLR